MGLYQSELNKQLHLRNRQKQEWDLMKKKMEENNDKKEKEKSQQQMMYEEEQRVEDQQEVDDTDKSKRLSSSMMRSARDTDSSETLQRAVDLLHNQNGNLIHLEYISLIFFLQATRFEH